MRIAFLGGTRFIGHVAAEHALVAGHDVTVLHRGAHACQVHGARDVLVERGDASALGRALDAVAPDALVDTRAMTAADARAVIDAVSPLALPVVVVSSADVYAQFGRLNGLAAPEPEPLVREDSPLTIPFPFRDLGPHEGGPDYDKKDVEAAFRAAALPSVTILRLPGVYGRRDPKRRFGELLDPLDAAHEKHAECTLPCRGGAPWRKSYVDVEDVAQAIVLAVEHALPGASVFNVAEESAPTMRERAEQLATVVGARLVWSEQAELPDALGTLGVMPNDLVLDTSAIRARLGYREVTTEASRIAQLVASLRASRDATSPR